MNDDGLTTVIELEISDDTEAKEIISELRQCGYDVTFNGQHHDHIKEAELLEYLIESDDAGE